ncbi:MAG: hypothetical protein ACF8QF_08270 [Phycisphaerales bacterium]
MRRPSSTIAMRVALPAVAGAVALASLGACNIVAPIAYLVGGPPKVPAAYELDKDRPTTIFVDDRASVVPRRGLRLMIGSEAESTLIEKKAIRQENMISADSTVRVALAERYGEPQSIDSIGEAVGAEVVIYVELAGWTLSRDGVSTSPAARLSVKVLDVTNNVRLWPSSINGHIMTVALPPTAAQGPQSRVEQNALEETLAKMTGLQIARLFFTHEEDALSGRLDD